MKKHSISLVLLLGFTFSSVVPLQAAQKAESNETQASPRLLAILRKKYINKQPLNKNEQRYFRNASVIAIGTGLALLLGGTITALRASVQAEKRRVLDVMKAFDVTIPADDVGKVFWMSGLDIGSFKKTFSYNPDYMQTYYKLSKQNGFKPALSQLTGIEISKLPTVKKHRKGAYYLE